MKDLVPDQLMHLATLAAIAEAGNFARAEAQLGVNRSAISKRIARIEAALGVPVFQRSARKMELTPAGALLLEQYHAVQEQLAAGVDAARESMGAIRGQVRVVCPSSLSVHVVAPALHAFASSHPGLTIDLRTPLDAGAAAGWDLQLRVAHEPPLDQAVRKLSDVTWHFCASAAYIAAHGLPQTRADLHHHRFVVPPSYERPNRLVNRRTGESLDATPDAPLTSNFTEVIFALVEQGAGVGLLPSFLLAVPRARENLRVVLQDWTLEGLPGETLYAVHAPGKYFKASARAVLQHLVATFAAAGSGRTK